MASRHVQHKLSAVRVKALKAPVKYEDGGGLRLVVGPNVTKRWVVRVTVAGKRNERGLGSMNEGATRQPVAGRGR